MYACTQHRAKPWSKRTKYSAVHGLLLYVRYVCMYVIVFVGQVGIIATGYEIICAVLMYYPPTHSYMGMRLIARLLASIALNVQYYSTTVVQSVNTRLARACSRYTFFVLSIICFYFLLSPPRAEQYSTTVQ